MHSLTQADRIALRDPVLASHYRQARSYRERMDGYFVFAGDMSENFCRPGCSIRLPRPSRIRFFATPAAAHAAGLTPCPRCRPDLGCLPPDLARGDTPGLRAMRLILDGEVDRTGIDGLAGLLGLTPRQVLRAVESVAGCGPLKVARAARAHLARLLLKETAAPMAQIARATGCTSVRQFNTTIRRFYGTTPSVLRFGARRPAASVTSPGPDLVLWCVLPHRQPFDADAFFTSPVTPVIPDLAAQGEHWYSRTVRLPHGSGHARLSSDSRGRVLARLSVQDARDVLPLYARTRLFLDLDADTRVIEEQLGRADPELTVHLSTHRGMRVPGSIDLQESLFTALVQELFSRPAAVLEDLVARLGEATSWGLVFPTAAAIAAHGSDVLQHHLPRPQAPHVPESLASPEGRESSERPEQPGKPEKPGKPEEPAAAMGTVLALARDLQAGSLQLHYGTSRSYLITRLTSVPGIDQGTAQRLTRRTLGDADDLRANDPAVIRGAAAWGLPTDPSALAAYGQRWAPWRSYAAMQLRAAHAGHQPPSIGAERNPHRPPPGPARG